MINWSKSKVWQTKAKNFSIEIIRRNHIQTINPYDEGIYRWFLYIYIFKKHYLFKKIDINKCIYKQLELSKIPFHGGFTYFEFIKVESNNNHDYFKIGADYQHYRDERFSFDNHSSEVFEDARILYEYLDKFKNMNIKDNVINIDNKNNIYDMNQKTRKQTDRDLNSLINDINHIKEAIKHIINSNEDLKLDIKEIKNNINDLYI